VVGGSFGSLVIHSTAPGLGFVNPRMRAFRCRPARRFSMGPEVAGALQPVSPTAQLA
jgi:hypothetical protein